MDSLTKDCQYTYLMVEGMNIYNTVFDTDQVSIIRGSSFLLKEAIESLADEFEELHPISTGASSGFFELPRHGKEDNDANGRDLIDKILEYFNSSPYCHFTFCIDLVEDCDLISARERLIALLRYQQMQSLSLAPDPAQPENTKDMQPCRIQGNRRAGCNNILPDSKNGERISLSVHDRFLSGKEKRSEFYRVELKSEKDSSPLKFTSNLQSLAKTRHFPKLSGKIALIYLDGNRFSNIQKESIQDAEDLRHFDQTIKAYRRDFLHKLIDRMQQQDTQVGFTDTLTENNELRLETLIWGGDEMLLVVPAWLGFDIIELFYQLSDTWCFSTRSGSNDKIPLTHSGGLVFCSAKTPLPKMRSLAISLADRLKEMKHVGRQNCFDYQVLESIDYPVEDSLNAYFESRYGKKMAASRFPIHPDIHWVCKNRERTRKILDTVPKGPIYRIAEYLTNDQPIEASSSIGRLASLMGPRDYQELTDLLSALFRPLNPDSLEETGDPDNNWQWLHLIELWDYLAPTTSSP